MPRRSSAYVTHLSLGTFFCSHYYKSADRQQGSSDTVVCIRVYRVNITNLFNRNRISTELLAWKSSVYRNK